MSFTPEQVASLKAPLDARHVKQRSQAGRQLSYIESWQAISEANRIFGFDGWHSSTRLKKLFDAYKDAKDKWRVGYMAKVTVGVKDGDQYVMRDGVGYGSGIDNDLGQAHESAIKEAESDARKRALMTFGNPFGLALYDKEQANVTDANGEPKHKDEPEPEPPKNAPGVSKARVWVNDTVRQLNACDGPASFMETVESQKAYWVRIKRDYPGLWIGPDGSGLRGEALKVATIFECRPTFDAWLKGIESLAHETKQAAE